MAAETQSTSDALIAVHPNCSMSPRGARLFFAGIALISLSIAGLFVAEGFWPVLPFAGLELFALGIALGISMRRGRRQEVIRINADTVVVESGDHDLRTRIELSRPWVRAELRTARIATYPSRLCLVAHAKVVEVGACLTETERRGLHKRLDQLLSAVEYAPAGSAAAGERSAVRR